MGVWLWEVLGSTSWAQKRTDSSSSACSASICPSSPVDPPPDRLDIARLSRVIVYRAPGFDYCIASAAKLITVTTLILCEYVGGSV